MNYFTHTETDPHSYFGMFPFDEISHVGINPSRYHKLFSREIIFEVFQRM